MAAGRGCVTRLLTWQAGRELTRAHSHEFGSTEFDRRDDNDARFSPLSIGGQHAAVLYAGTDDRTAAAETIFRTLPDRRRPRRVFADRYRSWQWTQIIAMRDLLLIAVDRTLAGAAPLVDGDATTYTDSRRLAGEMLAANDQADGLIWCSNQLHDEPSQQDVEDPDAAVCVLLVERPNGGGVTRKQLAAAGPSLPFLLPSGMARLDVIGVEFDVTIVRA